MDSDDDFYYESDSKIEVATGEDCFCLDSEYLSDSDKSEHEDDFSYAVLDYGDVVSDMLALIKQVNTIVEISPTVTRILLIHFKWDTEKLYEKYFGGDPDNLFREAHVVNPKSAALKSQMKTAKKRRELCEICYRKLSLNLLTSLECGHRYCIECWTTYLTTKIMDEGEVQSIPCFAVDCDILVDDNTIMNLIVEPSVKAKYQYLITNNFISCNRLLRHCPQPGCCKVIKVPYVDASPVTCSCGHTFCFQCAENWHDPITCRLLKNWQKKYRDDSASFDWIASNTKECPNCNVRIEKNGGCNHMVCKNQNCKFEFCWVCMHSWNDYDLVRHNCHSYEEQQLNSKEESKSALKKYLFHYDRYMNQVESLKFENELYASVKLKMLKLQHAMSWVETQFLKRAVNVLCSCRQTLMYTYVFAFYLVKSNEAEIFKANQQDLQRAVEQLSAYLERDINEDNVLTIKQNVEDKLRYCDSRRQVLLNHVHEGYDNGSWQYSDI